MGHPFPFVSTQRRRCTRALATVVLATASVSPASGQAPQMARAEEPGETTFTLVRPERFPLPAGITPVALANAGFESPLAGASEGLRTVRLERIESASAPEGRAFLRSAGAPPGQLSLDLPAREARPHVVSFWLRSTARGSGTATSVTNATYFGKVTPLTLPNTGGAWQHVGLFFRTAPGTTAVQVLLRFAANAPTEIDDVQFRAATEEEFSTAYAAWRAHYPARDLAPRRNDGRNLALFVSKLTSPDPARPLRVMGIGSSYTNMLGNGETLIQHVRAKFPHAPPVLYTKHVGSAVEFDFTRGWMRQHVLGERPDLVILYSGGRAADLEKLLADFRAHSSADVIVASLHLRAADKAITDASVNAPEWDAIRAVAEKYGCEWVDNRREWARYLQDHDRPIEWLLKDAVHQNDHGALVINENICRHLTPHPAPAGDPATRERRLSVTPGRPGLRAGEAVTLDAAWEHRPDGAIRATQSGARARVRFHGHRLDVITETTARPGRARVTIDGRPGGEYPAFVTTLIIPGPKNFKPQRGLAADRAPHQILLGDPARIVPQAWTLRMTSDTGDYELTGSVTGHAGRGNNGADTTIELAQISVPAALWRRRLETDGRHANRTGDIFTWEVRRATLPVIEPDPAVPAGTQQQLTLADQLPSGWHEVEIVSDEPGEFVVHGFVVHEPAIADPRGRSRSSNEAKR